MPIFYILKPINADNHTNYTQEISFYPGEHMKKVHKLLIDTVISDLGNELDNQQKNDLRNFLQSHYNGNIYVSSLKYYLKEYNNQLEYPDNYCEKFDKFYTTITLEINDCQQHHRYPPSKYNGYIFGKIVV